MVDLDPPCMVPKKQRLERSWNTTIRNTQSYQNGTVFLSLFFIYLDIAIFSSWFSHIYMYIYISTPPSATPCHIPHATILFMPRQATSRTSVCSGPPGHRTCERPTWSMKSSLITSCWGTGQQGASFGTLNPIPGKEKKQMKPVVDVGAYGFTESMGLCNGAVLY